DRPLLFAVQLAGARFAVAIDERRRIHLQACEDLSAVARARAPAGAFTFEDDDRRADAREVARRGKTRVAGADEDDVLFRESGVAIGAGRWLCGDGVPPVRVRLHRRAVCSGRAADPRIARPRCSCTKATTFS